MPHNKGGDMVKSLTYDLTASELDPVMIYQLGQYCPNLESLKLPRRGLNIWKDLAYVIRRDISDDSRKLI